MKSSQPKRGNKAQIWNTAEGDKHEAQGESFFSLPPPHIQSTDETVLQRYHGAGS